MNPPGRLLDKRFSGFRRLVIPHALDDIVASVLQDYRETPAAARGDFIDSIKPRAGAVFSAYGFRLAAVAVRETSSLRLLEALEAAALAEARMEDRRLNNSTLCVINHSAELLGVDPKGLVAQLDGKYPSGDLDLFKRYFAKDSKRKSLGGFKCRR